MSSLIQERNRPPLNYTLPVLDNDRANTTITMGSIKRAIVLALTVLVALGVGMFAAISMHPGFEQFARVIALGSSAIIFALIFYFLLTKNIPGFFTTMLFSSCEGMALGYISYMFAEAEGSTGIIGKASIATAVACIVSVLLYTTGTVKVTSRFRAILAAATLAALVFYLASFIIGIVFNVSFYGGPLGVAISAVMIIIACAHIINDANDAHVFVERQVPDSYKWIIAYGAVASIVWIYMEMLRIFASSRR